MINIFKKHPYFFSSVLFISLLASGPHVYAFFDHFEYDSPEHRYERERAVFNGMKEPCDWALEFPTYNDWQANNERQERAALQYLADGVIASFCSQEEYERYLAGRQSHEFIDGWRKNQLDADREAPSSSECPQAQERKGPGD